MTGESLVVLQAHPTCTDCRLHASARNPGLPTRPYDGGVAGSARQAVLFIGKAPGIQDDAHGTHFSGSTRMYMNKLYAEALGLNVRADIYLSNAVRCRLPNPKAAIPAECLKACRKHLLADLEALDASYDEIVLVACGPDALKQIGGKSLSSFVQGTKFEVAGRERRVFATYNPAILEPRNDPSKKDAVFGHLLVLRRYLESGEIPVALSVHADDVDYFAEPPVGVPLLSLDIETYGCVEGLPAQNYFHPVKCMYWDGVRREDLIQTVALAWREGKVLRNRIFVTDTEEGWNAFVECMERVKPRVIVGHNVGFDVINLRARDARMAGFLDHFGAVGLCDTAVMSFLDSDVRFERSLKALSPLLAVTSYESEKSLKTGERYSSAHDVDLHKYNVKDAMATYMLFEEFVRRRKARFGDNTAKHTPLSMQYFSDLLWLCVVLMEHGLKLDAVKLQNLRQKLVTLIDKWAAAAKKRDPEFALHGKGSKKYKAKLALRLSQELNLTKKDGLIFTDLTGEVSTKTENMQLFLEHLPLGSPDRRTIKTLLRFSEKWKLYTSYVCPLLGLDNDGEPKPLYDRDSTMIEGMVYPKWFPVPTSLADKKGASGGTQQVRITAGGPGVATFPKAIQRCEISRVPGGVIGSWDASQIELRVPAGYSGDPEMLAIFETGRSMHAESASRLVGFEVDKRVHPQEYFAGKTANFLRIFRGTSGKLQKTMRAELGIEIPLSRCDAFIAADKQVFPTFYAWQDAEIALAKRQKYLEIPLVGIHRSFVGSEATIEETYIPTICNVRVQGTAALFILSAQIAVLKWLKSKHWLGTRVWFTKNVYDAGAYDYERELHEQIRGPIYRAYVRPPLYLEFIRRGIFHPVRLDCEFTLKYNGSDVPIDSKDHGAADARRLYGEQPLAGAACDCA